MDLDERVTKLERKCKELQDLIYKISYDLTPRVWKLENPGKDISDNPDKDILG